MYVCLCKGITDSQILQAIDGGARSLRALRQELDVMTQCGKCGCHTKDLLQAALAADINSDLYYSAA